MKKTGPENSLGIYLTLKSISNIDIFSKTGIPVSDLSKMRNGKIGAISAKRLYLISLVSGDSIGYILDTIYPNLQLLHKGNPPSKRIKPITTQVGKALYSLEEYTFETISYKTGIKISRLRNLATKDSTIILSHELYLIELAANREAGSLFTELFQKLKLNSDKEQKRLREGSSEV